MRDFLLGLGVWWVAIGIVITSVVFFIFHRLDERQKNAVDPERTFFRRRTFIGWFAPAFWIGILVGCVLAAIAGSVEWMS